MRIWQTIGCVITQCDNIYKDEKISVHCAVDADRTDGDGSGFTTLAAKKSGCGAQWGWC